MEGVYFTSSVIYLRVLCDWRFFLYRN